ncbi:MAG: class I SAM-dependent methyltransferase [Deltaproteobacteria bacterium]|nr:class I SAM-dependent methyltransferase [Deltaproteobacteria bacterium]
MTDNRVAADYQAMDLSKARLFDKQVQENFMPAIVATARQIMDDYAITDGICVDVGCGTARFAIELCRHSNLKIYGLEAVRAIYEVAKMNVEQEGLANRVTPMLGDAQAIPFENEFADLIISRGSYHCWENRVLVFKEIHRVLKKGGIGFVGGGFGRYVSETELERMRSLRDRSLKDGAKAYQEPDELRKIVQEAGVSNFRIIDDRSGLWAELKK